MGDGTEENPFTREDVLKAVEENGGTADGIDLSGKVFKEGIDLRGLDLEGIILKETTLTGAHLEGANLSFANIEGTHLYFAYLKGVTLWSANLSPDTRLEEIDWGNYILGEEQKGVSAAAAITYRRLKIWYTNAGRHDVAGVFFYREQEANRKSIQNLIHKLVKEHEYKSVLRSLFHPEMGLNLFWLWIYRLICGYGEKPYRVVVWAVSVIFGLAAAYYFCGSFSSTSFLDTLYYSAVSFTALGYGNWAPQPIGWVKGLGAVEAFIGVFTMALFLVAFVRKMTR